MTTTVESDPDTAHEWRVTAVDGEVIECVLAASGHTAITVANLDLFKRMVNEGLPAPYRNAWLAAHMAHQAEHLSTCRACRDSA